MDRRDKLRQAAKMYSEGHRMTGEILKFFNENKEEVVRKAQERIKKK